jgi:hypothetical protein
VNVNLPSSSSLSKKICLCILCFVSGNPNADVLASETPVQPNLINSKIKKLEERLNRIGERLERGSLRLEIIQNKYLNKQKQEDDQFNQQQIIATSNGEENSSSPTNPSIEVASDLNTSVPEQPSLQTKVANSNQVVSKKKRGSYYFSFAANRNFASDTKVNTLTGSADLDRNTGFGVSLEMGRSFGAFELGLSTGFDHMRFGDMSLGNLRVTGKGESSVYHVTAKPSLILELNDRVLVKSGLIVGLASRQSEYEVLSVGFKESGQDLSMIWGLHLGTYFTMSDHHQLFANYRLLGTPSADEFEGFISHSIEGGFRLIF